MKSRSAGYNFGNASNLARHGQWAPKISFGSINLTQTIYLPVWERGALAVLTLSGTINA